jgi:hypothetical protein
VDAKYSPPAIPMTVAAAKISSFIGNQRWRQASCHDKPQMQCGAGGLPQVRMRSWKGLTLRSDLIVD